MNNFTKWFKCFIEWKDEDGTYRLSIIPWHVLLMGIFGDTEGFEWSWIPPWKVILEK